MGRAVRAATCRDALGGALVAGGAASWLTAPRDLAKLRLQVARGAARAPPFAATVARALRDGGVRGLFRGAGARAPVLTGRALIQRVAGAHTDSAPTPLYHARSKRNGKF